MTTYPAHGQIEDLSHGLSKALRRAGCPPPSQLERLSGGASMESWRFRSGDTDCVLRRAPSLAMMADRPLSHHGEASLIRAARQAGVSAPEVLLELEQADGLGSGFVMRCLPGTPEPLTILQSADPDTLLADFARELAAIHSIPTNGLPAPEMDTVGAVIELKFRFLSYGGDRPILALALRWLEHNLPEPVTPRLVHGDFRMGNLLVDEGRLTGVLDWELAHLGDPHEDLAFGCMTVWRFARPDRPAFGLGSIDAFSAAYTAASGTAFEPARFRFWLIYRTVWWALGCLQMGLLWRGGLDRSLERVVVARRASEQELDQLLLLEEQAPTVERARHLPAALASLPSRQGEPGGAEILTAISEWLANDVKPLVSGRGKFDLAVARNALGIVARELEQRPQAHDADLSAQMLSGIADLATPGMLARLRRMVLDKVAADMPKYPALATARALWEGP